jgi:hypothetical protein
MWFSTFPYELTFSFLNKNCPLHLVVLELIALHVIPVYKIGSDLH